MTCGLIAKSARRMSTNTPSQNLPDGSGPLVSHAKMSVRAYTLVRPLAPTALGHGAYPLDSALRAPFCHCSSTVNGTLCPCLASMLCASLSVTVMASSMCGKPAISFTPCGRYPCTDVTRTSGTASSSADQAKSDTLSRSARRHASDSCKCGGIYRTTAVDVTRYQLQSIGCGMYRCPCANIFHVRMSHLLMSAALKFSRTAPQPNTAASARWQITWI